MQVKRDLKHVKSGWYSLVAGWVWTSLGDPPHHTPKEVGSLCHLQDMKLPGLLSPKMSFKNRNMAILS